MRYNDYAHMSIDQFLDEAIRISGEEDSSIDDTLIFTQSELDAMEKNVINTGKQSNGFKINSGSFHNGEHKDKRKKGRNKRNNRDKRSNPNFSSSDKNPDKWSSIICSKCRGIGHVASVCPSVAPNLEVLSPKNSGHLY